MLPSRYVSRVRVYFVMKSCRRARTNRRKSDSSGRKTQQKGVRKRGTYPPKRFVSLLQDTWESRHMGLRPFPVRDTVCCYREIARPHLTFSRLSRQLDNRLAAVWIKDTVVNNFLPRIVNRRGATETSGCEIPGLPKPRGAQIMRLSCSGWETRVVVTIEKKPAAKFPLSIFYTPRKIFAVIIRAVHTYKFRINFEDIYQRKRKRIYLLH